MDIGHNKPEPAFYIAVILYESSSDAPEYMPLYEESFVLIKATSEEEAWAKAQNYGKGEEVSYPNENREMISWSLKQVIDVTPVLAEKFDDGSELYSRYFRDYNAYRAFEPLLSGEL